MGCVRAPVLAPPNRRVASGAGWMVTSGDHVVVFVPLRTTSGGSHRPTAVISLSLALCNARSRLCTEQLQLLNEPWTEYLSAEQHKLSRQDASGAAEVTIWGKVRGSVTDPPPPLCICLTLCRAAPPM